MKTRSANDLFVFILEDTATGKVRGTCQAFSQVGTELPFYSYRIGRITQHSKELDRTFRADMLTLCTDLDGASEVGGLYLDATERSAGVGKLLARSRYLFIKTHRDRFGDTHAGRTARRHRRCRKFAVLGRACRAASST